MQMSAARHMIFSIVVILSFCLIGIAAGTPDDHPSTDAAVKASASAPAIDLKADVGQLTLHGDTLANAFNALGIATHQKIVVNWRALAPVRVVKTLPVTVDLTNLSLEQALKKLLLEIGGQSTQLAIELDTKQATIIITTPDDEAKNLMTRVYDVRHALAAPATRQRDLAALLNRIRGIDPLSWKEAGGQTGSVRELSGQLIVTQTAEVQKRVAAELHDILPAD